MTNEETIRRRRNESLTQAWDQLSKLLLRIGIIDESMLSSQFVGAGADANSNPIAFGGLLGAFDELDAAQRVATQLGLVCSPLPAPSEAASLPIDDSVLALIPLQQWRDLCALPFKRASVNRPIRIVMANPLDTDARQTIEYTIGESVAVTMGLESHILNLLNHCEGRSKSPLTRKENPQLAAPLAHMQHEEDGAFLELDAAPVVRVVNEIFTAAFQRRVSDIHISSEKNSVTVRFRRDGVLEEFTTLPVEISAPVTSRVKLLAGMDISEKRRPQDGRIRISTDEGTRDLRVSTVPSLYGEKIVARLLSGEAQRKTLTSLSIPTDLHARLEADLKGTSQVILVTGPTGSGKTSTLYAAIDTLHDGARNIVTIEEPIEYRLAGITQIQVNNKIGVTFAEALRSVLRQDPDVVVVGEIRDAETASIAMNAAQTGHLVLSTLHTNSAVSAITRLLDLGAPRYLISSSIKGILAQRLVRALCTECSVVDENPCHYELLNLDYTSKVLRTAKGCTICGGTGFNGRFGLYSYLHVSSEVRDGITRGASEDELQQLGRACGFVTLVDAARDAVAKGKTSLEEVLRVVGAIQPTASLADTPTALTRTPRQKRILIAEDDENIRVVLSMILERAHYDVECAKNGREALEMILKSPPDLFLCDLMMPHMDGHDAVKILKRDPLTRSIPVLMLTAADTPENEIKLLESGADDFVSKVSDQRVLLTRIERLLQ